MDNPSKPRYDQAPENFSESGARVNRNARTKLATNQAGIVGDSHPTTRNEQQGRMTEDDRRAVDSVTRGAGSTAESLYSCYSLGQMAQFLTEEGGRSYSALNRIHFLPADNLEWIRLEKVHMALHLAVGTLYPCSQVVREILKPEPGVSKEILDLGCGSGLWAIEMAQEFPHVDILGVDLVPIPLEPDQLPANLRMEVDDINLGLSHFYGRFDMVHMRSVYAGLKDYQKSIHEAQRCVKPGGIILVFVPELEHLDERRDTYLPIASDTNPDGSWHQRFVYELKTAASLNGGDRVGGATLLDKGFWDDDDIMDPNTCGTGSIYLPIGAWPTSPNQDRNNRLQFSGALMKQAIISFDQSCRFLLIKYGLPAATVDEWISRAEQELQTVKFKSWMRMRMAWGRRRADLGLPAPSLSVPDIYIPRHLQLETNTIEISEASTATHATIAVGKTADKADAGVSEHLYENNTKSEAMTPVDKELYQVEVYNSKEESLRVIEQRMALRGPLPSPLIVQAFSQLHTS